jgi:hypothetical protein
VEEDDMMPTPVGDFVFVGAVEACVAFCVSVIDGITEICFLSRFVSSSGTSAGNPVDAGVGVVVPDCTGVIVETLDCVGIGVELIDCDGVGVDVPACTGVGVGVLILSVKAAILS